MTEKSFFVYKLFVIKYFILCKNCTPPLRPLPEKGHPLFPNKRPLLIEVLPSPPPPTLFSPSRKGGGWGEGVGAHTIKRFQFASEQALVELLIFDLLASKQFSNPVNFLIHFC